MTKIMLLRDAVKRNQRDARFHHILAWELDSIGESPLEVEEHYCEAIQLDPTNPIYHSRYITFLIDRARHRAALLAWIGADSHIPRSTEDEIRHRIRHLDQWVAQAWVDAEQVFMLGEMGTRFPELLNHDIVGSHIAHAIETGNLEVAVHPPGTPHHQRWVAPPALPSEGRTAWYPGIVRHCGPDGAMLVFADPDHRISRSRILNLDECNTAQWQPKTGYVAIGVYGDRFTIIDIPTTNPPTFPKRLNPDRFRQNPGR